MVYKSEWKSVCEIVAYNQCNDSIYHLVWSNLCAYFAEINMNLYDQFDCFKDKEKKTTITTKYCRSSVARLYCHRFLQMNQRKINNQNSPILIKMIAFKFLGSPVTSVKAMKTIQAKIC